MKIKRIIALVLCPMLLCGLLFGCTASGEKLDGNLVINLDSVSGSECVWQYVMTQDGIIEEVSAEYIPVSGTDVVSAADVVSGADATSDTDTNVLTGSAGTYRFEFKAVAPGEVGLQFTCYQTAGDDTLAVMIKHYGVVVDDKLAITLYDMNEDVSGTDQTVSASDEPNIEVGSTFTQSVLFGETTQEVELTWAKGVSEVYIGVDQEHITMETEGEVDCFVPVSASDEPVIVGTSMQIYRYVDSEYSAKELASFMTSDTDADDALFSDFSTFTGEINKLPAYGVYCYNEGGLSANYYYVDDGSDVVSIAIFYEGLQADDIGARLEAMLKTIVF